MIIARSEVKDSLRQRLGRACKFALRPVPTPVWVSAEVKKMSKPMARSANLWLEFRRAKL